jgi:HemY protein
MLWSLLKVLIFVAIVGALAWGAGFLMESTGGLQVTAGGSEITLGPLQSVLALVVLRVALWIILKLASLLVATLRFINGDETALSRYFTKNREQKGYKALSEGMMALASGDGSVAMSKAAKAEKYLAKPELTNLLTAQAAEMSGDRRKAEEVYKKLVKDEATRFVGVRGIMMQKLADGDTDMALQLAERAFALKPRHEETQDVLLKLQAQGEDWAGARKTLAAKLKSGSLPRDVHKRREAVLALSQSKAIADEDSSIEAQEAAIEANRLSPDLIPAAVMAARSYIEKGKPRYAVRVITKAWGAQPHPELAAAFAQVAPDETPVQRIKRFEKLVKINPDHPESKMLKAELHIAAEDFPAARRALGDLVETAPDARSLTIMAAIERGEGSSDAVIKGWLARAVSAPRGPQWICDACNHIHGEWAPVCGNCASFDTLSWKSQPQSEIAAPTGMAMLPLIVGALEDKSSEAMADAEPAEDVVDDVVEIVDAEVVVEEDASDTSDTGDTKPE